MNENTCPIDLMQARIERIRQGMQDVDALVVTSYENTFYLSGVFLYYAAVIVPRRGNPVLLVKHLDCDLAREASWFSDIREYSLYPTGHPDVIVDNYAGAIARVLTDLGLAKSRIGIGDFWALLRPFEEVKERLPDAVLHTTPTLLEDVRLVKDNHELYVMTQAAQFIDDAMAVVSDHLGAGVREHELCAEAAYAVWRAAPDCTLWHAIVASGPHALSPHAKITARALEPSDTVIIDLVLGYAGYYAGLTRTFIVGEPTSEQRAAFEALYTTKCAILEKVHAGLPMSSIAQVGRDSLTAQGYASYIKHSFGHHIGTFPHEEPFLTIGERRPIQVNMVMCIEPAIYIPGVGGFRIGEYVVATPEELKPLTQAPHQVETWLTPALAIV